jgi:hypothetical protein
MIVKHHEKQGQQHGTAAWDSIMGQHHGRDKLQFVNKHIIKPRRAIELTLLN